MIIKQLVDEDFVNYKTPSMYIGFPKCDFKCERECGLKMCQNSVLAASKSIHINTEKIIKRYLLNDITKSIVLAGLEPFDTYDQLIEFVSTVRNCTLDDIVIYTGYYKHEIINEINEISKYKNIVVKYGRYIPDSKKIYDEVLGVTLASENQYAEKIS